MLRLSLGICVRNNVCSFRLLKHSLQINYGSQRNNLEKRSSDVSSLLFLWLSLGVCELCFCYKRFVFCERILVVFLVLMSRGRSGVILAQ